MPGQGVSDIARKVLESAKSGTYALVRYDGTTDTVRVHVLSYDKSIVGQKPRGTVTFVKKNGEEFYCDIKSIRYFQPTSEKRKVVLV